MRAGITVDSTANKIEYKYNTRTAKRTKTALLHSFKYINYSVQKIYNHMAEYLQETYIKDLITLFICIYKLVGMQSLRNFFWAVNTFKCLKSLFPCM